MAILPVAVCAIGILVVVTQTTLWLSGTCYPTQITIPASWFCHPWRSGVFLCLILNWWCHPRSFINFQISEDSTPPLRYWASYQEDTGVLRFIFICTPVGSALTHTNQGFCLRCAPAKARMQERGHCRTRWYQGTVRNIHHLSRFRAFAQGWVPGAQMEEVTKAQGFFRWVQIGPELHG